MEKVHINGEIRQVSGKSINGGLRREGKLPAVIYGRNDNILFSTSAKAVKDIVYTPDFKLAEIDIDGATHLCILKDIQFHPVSEEIVHIDFLKLYDSVPVKLEVPIRFKGSSPGVKLGGKLIQQLRKVKIKTTPEHMVDTMYADISELGLGQAIRVKDLISNENIEIMNNPAVPIATIEIPRALKSAAAAEAKASKGK
ncbi:MAG TPA: 50S ribosomal protein L25 [Saprospiraceae bacterium]|nr:50S ribosomal protein L25 [Saprospiraceae bacterium]